MAIKNSNINGFDIWLELSKKSSKWNTFSNKNITIRTLHWIAKKDNLEEYNKLFSSIKTKIISLPDYGNPVQSYVYYINKLDNIFSNDICNYNELKNLYIYTRNIVNCNNQFTIEVSRLIIQDATNIGAIFCNTCNCDLISKFVDLKYWYCMYRIL